MNRVLQRTTATVTSPVLYGDGDIPSVLPTEATVTIRRSDGTIVQADASTNSLSAGVFSITLSPTDTAALDTFTLEWTAPAVGTTVTTAEVVGGFLFTIPEARRVTALANVAAADIAEIRTTIEQAVEDWTGALVPRYTVDVLSGTGTLYGPLRLTKPYVRTIRSITVDGTDLSLLDNPITYAGGVLHGYRWPRGYSNIIVGYEHGRDRPPERLRREALHYARTLLVDSPIDDRASTFSSVEGFGTYALVTAGRGGSLFGHPGLDAAVQAERIPSIA